MKKILFLSFVLVSLNSFAQTPNEFNPETYVPTYSLKTPEGWGVERFGIPIEFAPSIAYKGVEDIRFTPGWGNVESEEYWSYAFLWYLDGKQVMDVKTIEKNLTAYYNGLVGRNIEPRKISKDKLVNLVASVKEVATEKGDLKTFSGTVKMLDYMAQKPMTLNCMVHVKSCQDNAHSYVFYQLSPKPFGDKVWKSLTELSDSFKCISGK
jgi:hypothetical protein